MKYLAILFLIATILVDTSMAFGDCNGAERYVSGKFPVKTILECKYLEDDSFKVKYVSS